MNRSSLSSVLFVVHAIALVVNFVCIDSTNSIATAEPIRNSINSKVNQIDLYDNVMISGEAAHQKIVNENDVDEALTRVKRSPDPKGKGGRGGESRGGSRYPSGSRRPTGRGGKLSATEIGIIFACIGGGLLLAFFIGIFICCYAKRNF